MTNPPGRLSTIWQNLKPHRKTGLQRGWPGYLLGGRIRTSTVALIIAFCLVWWVYDTYRPTAEPVEVPQVVPPGFIPDPEFTWVPRSRVQQSPVTVTETITPTPTTTTEPTTTEPSETTAPPLPWPLCLPDCPPSSTPESSPELSPPPSSEPGQSPTTAPATPGTPVPTTAPPR